MKLSFKVFAFTVLSVSLFHSCVSPTKIEKRWISEDQASWSGANEKTIVFAFVKSEADRTKMEDLFNRANSNVFASHTVVKSQDIQQKKAEIKGLLMQEGFKRAITMRLVRKSNTNEWVPSNYLNSYDSYHTNFMMDYYNPGYYITGTEYFVETNVFSIADGKLLWSVTTKTPETLTRDEFIDELGAAVIKQLRKDNLLE